MADGSAETGENGERPCLPNRRTVVPTLFNNPLSRFHSRDAELGISTKYPRGRRTSTSSDWGQSSCEATEIVGE